MTHIRSIPGPKLLVLSPPFVLSKSSIAAASFTDIVWNKAKSSSLIHLHRVPRVQPEWKKHAEAMEKCRIAVFGDWGSFEDFSRRIASAKHEAAGDDPELERIRIMEVYQKRKLWTESTRNLKALEQAKEKLKEGTVVFISKWTVRLIA